MNRFHQLFIACDQVVNVIFGGWADETISARAYRNHTKSKAWFYAMHIINGIFFWQKHHCRGAHNQEQLRLHLPVAFRGA